MIIEHPNSSLPAKLRGLHLFHDGPATCAQRVRFVLGEKGLTRGPDVPWDSDAEATLVSPPGGYVSRRVSLRRRQHMTAAYAAIQPNMVVPALVHDGVLHIESVDIVRYIDHAWPKPALVPHAPQPAMRCGALVDHAKGLHRSIRFILFRWSLPRRLGTLGAGQLAALRRLEANDSPEQLVDFYDRYAKGAFGASTFIGHLRRLERGFAALEARLSDGRRWLLGDDFSLADIMWALKVLRLWEVRYPLARHFPALEAWYRRATARPSFRDGVWRDTRAVSLVVRGWSALAHLRGRGIESSAQRPPPDAFSPL